MEQCLTTVFREAEGFYEEKKSRFIAHIYHVTDETEVEERLREIRKRYYDARHHCYAYVIGADRMKVKCSDDGEPQKTAGVPILSVINGAGATDTLIVVTRYFGGTLLGTGGLVRAYTKAAQDGLGKALVYTKRPAELMHVSASYEDYNRLQRFLSEQEIPPTEVLFSEKVTVRIPVPAQSVASFEQTVRDFTKDRANTASEGPVYYAVIEGKTELFTV